MPRLDSQTRCDRWAPSIARSVILGGSVSQHARLQSLAGLKQSRHSRAVTGLNVLFPAGRVVRSEESGREHRSLLTLATEFRRCSGCRRVVESDRSRSLAGHRCGGVVVVVTRVEGGDEVREHVRLGGFLLHPPPTTPPTSTPTSSRSPLITFRSAGITAISVKQPRSVSHLRAG